jgi:hypothetical protein
MTAFLWLKCCLLGALQGITAAEFALVSTDPANAILAFTPAEGWVSAGTETELLFAGAGCPGGPVVAGTILVSVSAPGSLCIGPDQLGTEASVDCSPNPVLWPIAWTGLDFGGGHCKSVAVESTSWGKIKATYR